MSEHLGELAALATAVLWAVTAVCFARAGARIGSMVLNGVRLVIAIAVLCVAAWALRGLPLPTDAGPHQWLWLSISGLIGFVFGDMCLFRAFVLLGPRLSSLVMAATPLITAVLGWMLLGESMGVLAIAGMALTVAGIAWAIASRQPVVPARPPAWRASTGEASSRLGVVLALGGALGQAGGLVLSKHGMAGYDPLAATQVRILAAIVGWMLVFTATGWWPRVRAGLRDLPGLVYATAGSILGPCAGVTLSLVAVQHTHAGVAASIMATSPVLIIPLSIWLDRERVGVAGVLGAVVAVCGVVLLFLR